MLPSMPFLIDKPIAEVNGRKLYLYHCSTRKSAKKYRNAVLNNIIPIAKLKERIYSSSNDPVLRGYFTRKNILASERMKFFA